MFKFTPMNAYESTKRHVGALSLLLSGATFVALLKLTGVTEEIGIWLQIVMVSWPFVIHAFMLNKFVKNHKIRSRWYDSRF